MPHIYLEYSDNITNLATQPILKSINQSLLEGGYVSAAQDLKSRAIQQTDYVIGLGDPQEAYLHAKVALLCGRDEATKTEISDTVLKAIQTTFEKPKHLNVQVCVEIIEMPKFCYSKVNFTAE